MSLVNEEKPKNVAEDKEDKLSFPRTILRIFASFCSPQFLLGTVQPCLTDSRSIRTPRYYGKFLLPLGKALTVSQNTARTSVNADNEHFFRSRDVAKMDGRVLSGPQGVRSWASFLRPGAPRNIFLLS